MNNKSSKKHMMRDISKFGSTKCFCDDGNLFQGLKTSFMRQIFGSCSVCFINIDQCLPNAMQKCTQMKKIYQESDSSFSLLLLLLQQANKQKRKGKTKKCWQKKLEENQDILSNFAQLLIFR